MIRKVKLIEAISVGHIFMAQKKCLVENLSVRWQSKYKIEEEKETLNDF